MENKDNISELKKVTNAKSLRKAVVRVCCAANPCTIKMSKSHDENAAWSKKAYDKDPESAAKLAARSKRCYHEDLEKSHADTATA